MRAEHIDGRYIVVRIGGDSSDTYAAERVTHTLDEVVEMANPDAGSVVEWCYAYSDDASEITIWQRYDMGPAKASTTHCECCLKPFYYFTGGTSFCKC